jgi:hypothetical protein
MRPLKRAEEFRAVQRESTRTMALLRKALFSLPLADASSAVEGGFARSPSPTGGGSGWGLPWVIRPRPNGTIAYYLGAVKVTDRRNSRLRCYFRHGG